MIRRDLSDRADRLRTLLIFLVMQAFLLTVNLNLLLMWGDEASAVNWAARPLGELLRLARAANQPPLYFLLAHEWLKLIGGADPLWSVRLLSGCLAICCTILLERLWLRRMTTEIRQWVLLFWTFSPCLLLFGRMARPYTLQTLLTVVAVWAAVRLAEGPEASGLKIWKRLAALCASLIALLYTQYLPGLAVWIGVNVLLLQKKSGAPRLTWRTRLLPNVLIAAAFAPWAANLNPLSHKDLYSLIGNAFLEAALKLAYGFYSLAFGEAIPIWVLVLSLLLAAPYSWVLFRGSRTSPWLLPAAVTALLGFIGAGFWVSYPFMGARLLFLLPLLMVALANGIEASGRLGSVFAIVLFAANAGGVWSYFGARDLLNNAYAAPQRQIATTIAARSLPADTVVWVDGLNVDESVLAYYLPAGFTVRVLRSAADADAAWSDLQANTGIHHVWFIRNPNDISSGHALEKLEDRMLATWHLRILHPYLPLSATNSLALKYVMHIAQPPRYIYQVWEFRR